MTSVFICVALITCQQVLPTGQLVWFATIGTQTSPSKTGAKLKMLTKHL